MNVNKENLEVVRASSKDETRQGLCTVRFEKDGTVATDGHMLAIVTYPEQFDNAELPECLPSGTAKDVEPFSIHEGAIKGLVRSIPKRSSLPILNNLYLDVAGSNNNGTAKFAASDLEVTTPSEVRKVDENFPPYEQVIPKDKDLGAPQGFNPALMVRAMTIMQKVLGKGVGCSVRVNKDPTGPMLIEGENVETGQKVTVVVMPMRL